MKHKGRSDQSGRQDVTLETLTLIPKQVEKVNQGDKGFVAAFSSTNLETNKLIKNIQRNTNYNNAKGYDELILVAVDML